MGIRVLHVGLGPIGAGVVRQVAERKGLTIVGGVDVDPAKSGRDLGDVVGLGRRLRIKVSDDLKGTLKAKAPDVVVLCTSSSLAAIVPQIDTIARAGTPIVSTTEELAYPAYSHKRLAVDHRRDRAQAEDRGPRHRRQSRVRDGRTTITLTGVCERVDRVEVDRVQDARIRRLPFQQKIGSGLTPEAFDTKVKEGSVRHVGLTESIAMIADAVGWTLDRITDDIVPKVATSAVSSDFIDRRTRPGLRPDSRRRWISKGRGAHPVAHGGISRRAGVVRCRADRGLAGALDEDRRRGARRHCHGLHRRQLNPQGAQVAAGAADDANPAHSVVFRRGNLGGAHRTTERVTPPPHPMRGGDTGRRKRVAPPPRLQTGRGARGPERMTPPPRPPHLECTLNVGAGSFLLSSDAPRPVEPSVIQGILRTRRFGGQRMVPSPSVPTLLLLDDDPGVLKVLSHLGGRAGFDVSTYEDPAGALDAVRQSAPDVAMVDLRLPRMGGLSVITEIKRSAPSCEVLLMSGYATVETAVEAVKRGAQDCVTKPFDISALLQKLDRLRLVIEARREDADRRADVAFESMIGSSPIMGDLFELIGRVAPHFTTALVTGETGYWQGTGCARAAPSGPPA